MSSSKFKVLNRILAVVLALIIVVGIMPVSVMASTTSHPGEFTITVQDESKVPINAAAITYEILVDNTVKVSSCVNTNDGEAVIPGISEFSEDIENGKAVEIRYEITKEGYNPVNDKAFITDVEDNIDVTMEASAVEEFTLTVNKTGNGAVKLNGNEEDTITVAKGSNVSLMFIPDEGSYIKEVKIGDKVQSIANRNLFETTVNVNEDVSVSVDFVKFFTVKILDDYTGKGKVTLDNESVSSKEYDENSFAAINAYANEGYQIKDLTINGEAQNIDDVSRFSSDLRVTQDINVAVTFVKVYTVTFRYDESLGKVTSIPESTGGSVIFEAGTKFKFSAVPNDTYRVSKVEITGENTEEFSDNSYQKDNPYKRELTADKDYSVSITFAPMVYDVKAEAGENGTVSVSKQQVQHGEDATVQITPDTGYTVKSYCVEGAEAEINAIDDKSIELKIGNVTQDISVVVEFMEISTADINNLEFNKNDAVVSNSDGLYVFPKNIEIKFSTDKSGIRIYDKDGNRLDGNGEEAYQKNECSILSSAVIGKIQLYYMAEGELIPVWHTVSEVTNDNTIKIVIDEDIPVFNVTHDNPNLNGFYNKDVNFEIEIDDKDEKINLDGAYSGIKTVKYSVIKDNDADRPTQKGILFSTEETNLENGEIKRDWNGAFAHFPRRS